MSRTKQQLCRTIVAISGLCLLSAAAVAQPLPAQPPAKPPAAPAAAEPDAAPPAEATPPPAVPDEPAEADTAAPAWPPRRPPPVPAAPESRPPRYRPPAVAGGADIGAGQALPARPPAEEPPDEPEPDPGPGEPHMWAVNVGLRLMAIFDDGFEPYTQNEVIAQLALGAEVVPLRIGPFGLAVSAEYDVGNKSDFVRGNASSLTLHRLSLGVRGGWLLADRLELFAHVAPAALHTAASIDDAGISRSLVSYGWTWNVDLTGGLAVRLGSAGARPAVRFWLLGEAGYGFAGEVDMEFAPEEDEDDPRQFGVVRLPTLTPEGFVSRLAFGLSF